MKGPTNGTYRLVTHCGNRGVFDPQCMLGCDPGWCRLTPEEQLRNMERVRAAIEAEQAPDRR